MLTDAELAQYHRDGYIVPNYRLPDAILEAISDDHQRLVKRHPQFTDYCPTVLAYDTSFLAYARIPEIVDMVGQIIGPDFALWNSSLFAKPAFKGSKTPWHQDGEYWPIRPVATCTAWLAIDDSTPENGCLRVIKGSHKQRRLLKHLQNDGPGLALNQELDPGEYDEKDAVDIVLKAGQISLHDVFLAHGSEPNRSPRSRRGLTLRYMPLTSVFDRALADQQVVSRNLRAGHSERTLFLIRGQDRTGRNDFQLRM